MKGAPRDRDLVDRVLLEEIELLSDLITAVGEAHCRLTVGQLDSLLGVSAGAPLRLAASANRTQSATRQRFTAGSRKDDLAGESGSRRRPEDGPGGAPKR